VQWAEIRERERERERGRGQQVGFTLSSDNEDDGSSGAEGTDTIKRLLFWEIGIKQS
jgi:hypothetical protein